MPPALIGIDWGTTSFRAYLLDRAGAVLDRIEAPRGILAVENGAFAEAFSAALAPWLANHGRLPAILSGMIGSRQGWTEAPYARCPAGLRELASALMPVPGAAEIRIVPGLDQRDAAGLPDVMRGEETQILGALTALSIDGGTFVLPGTHSKWATVEGGRIAGFRTFMTGEVFAALRAHTILGRLMAEAPGSGSGFRCGLDAARRLATAGDLLNRLFSVRSLGLFGDLPAHELADYLSGLLIGAEITAAHRPGGETVVLVGSEALCARYRAALDCVGVASTTAPADCVVLGHLKIAEVAGLVA
jgi:2-dehydro-3-deoxygalactonokinase